MRRSPCEPRKIEVMARECKPVGVKLGHRLLMVKRIVNMWRIDDEWWRRPISRLYFLVELERGIRVTVFKDLIGGGWYRQNCRG